jgi:antirestriction protein ArdC
MPRNLKTGKVYRGINPFLLGFTDFASPYWVTYKQCSELGGKVVSGPGSGTQIVFWKRIEKTNKTTGEEYSYMMMRHYTVFNTDQCEGITHKRLTEYEASKDKPVDPFAAVEAAEEIITGYVSGPTVQEVGTRACYSPPGDHVSMPPRDTFDTPACFYSVLFHELTHSTGHERRLNREGVTNLTFFGSHEYSKEELVAEMGAAFLAGHAGISTDGLVQNSAAYLHSWAKKLGEEPKLIVQAASCAQRAVDHILGTTFEKDED